MLDRIGAYRVTGVLGRGGFGEVFRLEADAGLPLAAKVLHSELVDTPEAIARFEREAALLTRLAHRSVVKVYEYGRLDDGRPYLIMELLEGTDLEQHLRAHGPLTLEAALAILEPVADALEAAHAAGVIHRDVKSSNVFLHGTPGATRVVLLDFGIAKLLDPDSVGLTSSRVAIGTPTSMAPEQISGGPITAQTDVYGVAALAFHLLTGRPPFEDPSPTVLQQLHLHARRPRASTLAALPAALDAPLQRGLDRDPARRPAGPRRFVATLRAILDETRPALDDTPRLWACVQVGAIAADASELELDRLDQVVDELLDGLQDAGLELRGEPGNAAVLVAPATDPTGATDANDGRDALAEALRACALALGSSAASVALYVDLVGDGQDLRWVPAGDRRGVFVSVAAATRLGLDGAAARDGWHAL
ncbi:MAG TPA: serine/threonine-protein kinase [Kofleriaceae bacterium]|nr:serine/threonine-protein kinase [Kofleriaceae bacterium]